MDQNDLQKEVRRIEKLCEDYYEKLKELRREEDRLYEKLVYELKKG